MPHLAHIALVVRDYDEALAFYVGQLGFALVEDTYQPAQDKRWVTIRPPNASPNATNILLSRASTDHQAHYIGDQAGGRVFLFLDAAGPIAGEMIGGRLRLDFKMKGGLHVTQWIEAAPGGQSAHNRMSVRKLGLVVAHLDETIRRTAP